MKEIKKNEMMSTESPRIEKYLKYNYEGIETITFEKVIVSPMGIPSINGYVNDDKEKTFSADIYDQHFEGDIITSNLTETDENFKNGAKNVSDIEKDEELQSK
ncbi:DUF1433 domain-containing protein [Carnobacterium gallinarum]|uniref:DUF1433 domain-containing protein n=1 Tax=Carnobacterium gallinarum TaxID=2749 RepID=UPI00068AF50D|nr:DUF1433 domain-containing protein [Carnobacterium gallinarum]